MRDLDLVPIMNLVTILIPFLLLAAQFVTFAAIDTSLPSTGAPPPDDPTELQLTVSITSEGFLVTGRDASLGATGIALPCVPAGCAAPESYDADGLASVARELKGRHPDEDQVVVVPESHIPYEVLVRAMDAAREDRSAGAPRPLFPTVVIAGTGGER
jgi:biopolymer transport protein ExbD